MDETSATPRRLALTALLVSLVLAPLSHAQQQPQEQAQVSEARDLAMAGLAAYDQGKYPEASEKLAEAYRVVQVPTLALYLGRSLVQQGQLVEALHYFDQARELPISQGDRGTQQQAQVEAAREYEALQTKLPRIRVELRGARADEVEVRANGRPLALHEFTSALAVNPGLQLLTVRKGAEVHEQQVHAEIGREHVVTFSFEPPRPAPAPPSPIVAPLDPQPPEPPREPAERSGAWLEPLAWSSVGVGAAGIVVGATTGLWALDLRRSLTLHCPDKDCPPEYHDDHERYRRLRTTSTVGFAVGAVGLATGGILLLQTGNAESTSRLELDVGISHAAVRGRF